MSFSFGVVYNLNVYKILHYYVIENDSSTRKTEFLMKGILLKTMSANHNA